MGKGFHRETGMGNAGLNKVSLLSYRRASLSLTCRYALAVYKRG